EAPQQIERGRQLREHVGHEREIESLLRQLRGGLGDTESARLQKRLAARVESGGAAPQQSERGERGRRGSCAHVENARRTRQRKGREPQRRLRLHVALRPPPQQICAQV